MQSGRHVHVYACTQARVHLCVCVGALMRLSSAVVYTSGRVVRVHVRASKLSPGAPEQPVVTNVFSFAFLAGSPTRPVVPETMVRVCAWAWAHDG